MINELLIIAAIIFLGIPTLWELNNDRHGDLNKFEDAMKRILMMVLISIGVTAFTDVNPVLAFNLSVAIFFLIFDYAINIILYRNHVISDARWFRYTGKSGVIDNIGFWKKLNPWAKLAIRVVYFGVSLYLFLTVQR